MILVTLAVCLTDIKTKFLNLTAGKRNKFSEDVCILYVQNNICILSKRDVSLPSKCLGFVNLGHTETLLIILFTQVPHLLQRDFVSVNTYHSPIKKKVEKLILF